MDKALSSWGWFQRKRTFSQGSFSLHSVILPVLFLPVIHWGSRTVLPFHGIFSFFPAKLILCTLCFMWAAKQMGTSMWLFSLIINSLTFYFILVCSRNSVLFTSRNEPILPALQCVVNAGEEEVQKGCSTSGTLIIEAWFSEYLVSLFQYWTEENQGPDFQGSIQLPDNELSFPLLQFPGLFMTHF